MINYEKVMKKTEKFLEKHGIEQKCCQDDSIEEDDFDFEELNKCCLKEAEGGEIFRQNYAEPLLRNSTPFLITGCAMENDEGKTIKVFVMVERLTELEKFAVLTPGRLFHYNKCRGCYEEISFESLGVLIDEILTEPEKRGLTDYKRKEVYSRLITTSSLQVDGEWNSDPHKINCENGILCVDVGDDFHLKPHNPEAKFTYCVNASYDESHIHCPTFDHFCETSLEGSAEKRQLLLEIMGCTLSDFYGAKKAFFLKGAPNSGKSVFLAFLERLIGPEMVSNISIHALNDRFAKAELYGKKVNIQAEMKADDLKDISTFKAITGQDKISGEYKGKSPFFFTPRCKLIFAGNSMPSSAEPEATKALLNRLVILLFNRSIPKEEQDPNLPERLWAERNSIFTLAIQAYSDLRKRNFVFTEPDESRKYIEYYGELDNNIKLFLEDECTVNPELVVRVAVLYDKYQEYCRLNGFETKKLGEFSKFMLETGDFQRKRINKGSGNNFWYYVGIGLKEDIACQE